MTAPGPPLFPEVLRAAAVAFFVPIGYALLRSGYPSAPKGAITVGEATRAKRRPGPHPQANMPARSTRHHTQARKGRAPRARACRCGTCVDAASDRGSRLPAHARRRRRQRTALEATAPREPTSAELALAMRALPERLRRAVPRDPNPVQCAPRTYVRRVPRGPVSSLATGIRPCAGRERTNAPFQSSAPTPSFLFAGGGTCRRICRSRLHATPRCSTTRAAAPAAAQCYRSTVGGAEQRADVRREPAVAAAAAGGAQGLSSLPQPSAAPLLHHTERAMHGADGAWCHAWPGGGSLGRCCDRPRGRASRTHACDRAGNVLGMATPGKAPQQCTSGRPRSSARRAQRWAGTDRACAHVLAGVPLALAPAAGPDRLLASVAPRQARPGRSRGR